MLVTRLLKTPQSTFFLLGPRGTGKSTWLRTIFPETCRTDLLSEETYQRLLANPGLFASELRAIPVGSRVIIDEVQRLPNLLNEVHRFIEERALQFVLCGSSARKLKAHGTNLLAGRALRRFMHPFVPGELGDSFVLDDALRFGLLPVVWNARDREETLRAYAQLYLKEEIQAEALVRNLAGFARFLPISALFHAQAINMSNIARDAGVSRTTVAGYLQILEDTLLCFRLPAFEAKLRVRERKLPKLYWIDPGIVRAMKQSWGSVQPEERGVLFEGLVAQLIRACQDYAGLADSFFYWSPAETTETEVDFLLARGTEFAAIEVKSGIRFAENWCRGLRAIAGLKGLRRRLVVYPDGPVLKTEDGIDVLPFRIFADALAGGLLWP
ncbi:MAG: ATP-binding protein [Planctomycetes bacterium]|nr:ATP-binding protein [Planctomycetota bacterium]